MSLCILNSVFFNKSFDNGLLETLFVKDIILYKLFQSVNFILKFFVICNIDICTIHIHCIFKLVQ